MSRIRLLLLIFSSVKNYAPLLLVNYITYILLGISIRHSFSYQVFTLAARPPQGQKLKRRSGFPGSVFLFQEIYSSTITGLSRVGNVSPRLHKLAFSA
jgi:hypothetical protein